MCRMSDWDSNQDDLSFRRTLLGSDDWNFKEPSSRSSSSNHTPVVPSRQADCTIPFTESHAADVAIPQLPIPRGALLRRRQISDPPPRESQARYLSVGSDVNSSRSFTARSHATSSGVSPRPSSQSPRRYFPSPRSVVEARALPPEDLQKVFNSYISARLKDGLNTASVEQHRQILQQVLEHQYYSFHKSQDSVSASTQGTDAPMTEKSLQLDMIANTRFSERMTEQTVKRRIIAARFNWSNVLRYMDRPPLTIQFAVSPRVRRLCEQQTWAALIDHAVLNSHRYIMEDVQRTKWYDGCGQTRDSNDRMDGQAKLYPTNGVAVARRLPRDRRSGDRELACQRQSLLLNTLFREGLYAYHDYATNKWLSPFYGFNGKDDYGSAARAHVLALPNRTFMADSEDFVQSPRPVSPLALSETRWHQLTSKRSSLSNSFSLDSNSPITSSFAPVENDAERRQGGSPMTHQMPDPEIAVSNAVRPPSHFNTGLYPYIICEDNSGKVHLFLEEDSPPPTSYLLQWLCRRHACRLQTVDERTRRANNFFKTVDGDEEGSVFSYAYVNVPEQREKELRPIALHLTDTQLPWLASQLQLSGFAEGGLALTDLFLALDIQRVLHSPQLLSSWLWMKNVFNAQRNLFSFSVTIRESTMDAQQSRHMSAFQARQMRPMSAVSSHVSREVALGLRPHPYTLFDQMNFFPFLEMLHLCNETPIEVLEDILGPHHLERYPDVEGEVASPLDDDGQEEEEEEEENCFYLRELYFVGERKIRTKNGYPSRHSDDASLMGFRVTSKRLPCIEVLWLDVLRLRRLTFGAGHTFLRELHIVSDNAFKSSMLSGVGRLPVLEVFHVEKLSIDTLGYLGECPKLRELLVHNCRFLPITTNSNPLQDVEKISTLEYLSLAYSSEVKTIENFAKCLSLKKIVLTRCNGISSASIRGFENLPHLEMLCLEFTRVSHFSIFSKSNALRVLRLDSCKRVLRTSIEGLEMNNSLEEISLSGTNVATISNLGAGCARVHTLDLSLCRYLDVEGLQGGPGTAQLVRAESFLHQRDGPSVPTGLFSAGGALRRGLLGAAARRAAGVGASAVAHPHRRG
ncbi:hypothetical protein, conserved [Angomonas deanei]|uniref:Leucine Rich repeat n=1 Tax=Angomonas deanei TaxID=59799 RepID=A0A7G2CFM1_9TRYP|nr:hypothetical protein, conserved [Angomonas deanei]